MLRERRQLECPCRFPLPLSPPNCFPPPQISCPWLGDEHPDIPDAASQGHKRGANGAEGSHLCTIAPLLQAYASQLPASRERYIRRGKKGETDYDEGNHEEGDDWYERPVAVYWDFISVYHDARGACEDGLNAIEVVQLSLLPFCATPCPTSHAAPRL